MSIISKTEFLSRFSIAEKAAILSAGDLHPAIRVYLYDLSSAVDVDLSFQQTIEGVWALENGGLLAAGRAGEILSVSVGGVVDPALGRFRVLPPFNESFPNDYGVISQSGSTYLLEDIGAFDVLYLEAVV